MNRDFIPYEEALALKQLGFDEECFGYYDNTGKLFFNTNGQPVEKDWVWVGNQILPTDMILAPLYQQVFRWFREKYGLYSMVDVDQTMEPKFCYTLSRYKGDFQWENILPSYSELYYTYEEAELACLNRLIEIIKNK